MRLQGPSGQAASAARAAGPPGSGELITWQKAGCQLASSPGRGRPLPHGAPAVAAGGRLRPLSLGAVCVQPHLGTCQCASRAPRLRGTAVRALTRAWGPLFWTPREHPGGLDAPRERRPPARRRLVQRDGRDSSGRLALSRWPAWQASRPRTQAQEPGPASGRRGGLQGSGAACRALPPATPVPCPERRSSRVSQPREAGWILTTLSLGLMVQGRPQALCARRPQGRQPPVLQHPGQLLPLPPRHRDCSSALRPVAMGASLCRLVWHLGLSPRASGAS